MPVERSPRILIVDDDEFFSTLLQRILLNAGYQVALAVDGREALARLASDWAFDAILLDRLMPGLDGLHVLEYLKRSPELRDIPVVLQTVLGSEAEMQEGLKAGAVHYLVKPLAPHLVLQVVAAAIRDFAARKGLHAELASTRNAMGLIERGVFRYQTLQQCYDLAALLAKACPDPKRTVVGLSELMINALEHGNLGISYAEKGALIEQQGWTEEIQRRQQLPEHQGQWVTVRFLRSASRCRFHIQDQGQGFAWRSFQEPSPERLFDSHGRGILLAKWETFDRLEYQGNGSSVLAETSIL